MYIDYIATLLLLIATTIVWDNTILIIYTVQMQFMDSLSAYIVTIVKTSFSYLICPGNWSIFLPKWYNFYSSKKFSVFCLSWNTSIHDENCKFGPLWVERVLFQIMKYKLYMVAIIAWNTGVVKLWKTRKLFDRLK